MGKWLAKLGLRFPDESSEAEFTRVFCTSNLKLVQVVFIVGAVLVYVFFIWDRIIDPINAEITHAIRGFVLAPIICISSGLLGLQQLERYFELIVMTAATSTSIGLAVIYAVLDHGFDYGAVGVVLIVFFTFSMITMRLPYYLGFCLASWTAFAALHLLSGNARSGMMIVNNLSIGTAVGLGIFSATVREIRARREFLTDSELRATKATVGELQRSNRALKDAVFGASNTHLLISYRRADSEAVAGRIRDRLVGHFGEDSVFMDIDSIQVGLDFREQIASAVRGTDILLAIIGPNWLGKTTDGLIRIRDGEDPVRIETEMALQNGVYVIPVLVGGANMPQPDALPESIRDLSFRNAVVVDGGRDFHQHVDRLIRSMELILEQGRSAKAGAPVSTR